MKSCIYILIIFIFSITSCKKDDPSQAVIGKNFMGYQTIEESTELEAFYSFYNADYDALITVSDNQTFGNSTYTNFSVKALPSSYSSLTVGTYFCSDNDGGNVIYCFDEQSPTGIFGDVVDIELGDSAFILEEFYIPERIHAESDDGAAIEVGSLVTWNEDGSNDLGVIILITYSPFIQSDSTIADSVDHKISWVAHTDDDGSYTIQSGMFDGIPIGALIEFRIGRGAYEIITNESDEVCKILILSTSGGLCYRAN